MTVFRHSERAEDESKNLDCRSNAGYRSFGSGFVLAQDDRMTIMRHFATPSNNIDSGMHYIYNYIQT